jgi:hypothetical protein
MWADRGGLREVQDLIDLHGNFQLLVGRHLTRASRQLASNKGYGWLDETGAAEIVLDSLVVTRDGRNDRIATPDGWRPGVIGTAEALLIGVKPTIDEVSRATHYSYGVTTNALSTLTKLGLLDSETARGPRSGRRVVDPDLLLNEYANAVNLKKSKMEIRCGLLWRDPIDALENLASHWRHADIAFSATGEIAAALISPSLTDISGGMIYVEALSYPDLINDAQIAGMEPMKGGRLLLRPFPNKATRWLSKNVGGVCLAPWPRVYADLRVVGVRGEEAAEHLKETVHARGTQ